MEARPIYLYIEWKLYEFKAKDFEINANPLCLGNILKYYWFNDMKETGINGYVYDFSVDIFKHWCRRYSGYSWIFNAQK